MGLAHTLRKKVENRENKIQERERIALEKKEAALEKFIEEFATAKIKQVHENFKDFEEDLKQMAEDGIGSYEIFNATELCNDKIREYEHQDSPYGNPLFRDPEIKKYIKENVVNEFIKSDALLDFISSLESDGFTPSFITDGFKNTHLTIKWAEVEKPETEKMWTY